MKGLRVAFRGLITVNFEHKLTLWGKILRKGGERC